MITSVVLLVVFALVALFLFFVLIATGVWAMRGKKKVPEAVASSLPSTVYVPTPQSSFREQVKAEKSAIAAAVYADMVERQFYEETVADVVAKLGNWKPK